MPPKYTALLSAGLPPQPQRLPSPGHVPQTRRFLQNFGAGGVSCGCGCAGSLPAPSVPPGAPHAAGSAVKPHARPALPLSASSPAGANPPLGTAFLRRFCRRGRMEAGTLGRFFGEAFTTRSRTGRYERYREQSLSRPGKRSAPRARVGSLANFAIPMKCGSSLSRRQAPQQQRALFLAAPAAAGGRQPPRWPPSCQLLGAARLCQQPAAAPWSGSARGAASPRRLGETQRQGKPDAAWSVCSER